MTALRRSAMTSEQRQRQDIRIAKRNAGGFHDIVKLRASHIAGDQIATEWLRRLGAI